MSTLEDKLDEVLKNQGIIIRMLTDLIEGIPDPAKRPDVAAALKPLLDSPMIKNNPMLAGMVDNMMSTMGGKK